jgi:hypothetical protein
MSLFVNRKDELEYLENEYKKKGASLVILYGRRRIGKTELVLKFLNKKPGVYYLSQKFNAQRQVDDFLDKVCPQIGVYVPKITKWDVALKFIAENIKEKPVIIIDEFPYLIEGDSSTISSFQSAWDLYLKDLDIMVIILGSSVGLMETEVLGYKSPLYGRRTGQMKIEPLKFLHIHQFFPKKEMIELAMIYGCLGGVPAYLNKFEEENTFSGNIEEKILKRSIFLNDEAVFLLKEELREPANYELILEAISKGKNRVSEIADETGMPVQNIPKYLRVLINLGFVKRLHPVILKKNRDIKTNTIYEVSDNFLKFWYSFVYPAKSEIEINRSAVISKILENYDSYMGRIFEDISNQFLRELNGLNKLPFIFSKIGRAWGKIHGKEKGQNTYEIDLVAFDEYSNNMLFIECKWQKLTLKEAGYILDQLKEKSTYIYWNNEIRKNNFCIIAKVIDGKENLREKGYLAFDLEDFEYLIDKS